MSERPLLSRREFLVATGAGLALSFSSDLVDEFIRNKENIETDGYEEDVYNFSNGVLVRGENEVFNVGDKKYKTKVNTSAVQDTFSAVNKRLGQEEKVLNYMESNPLRVALHQNGDKSWARYDPVSRKFYPEIEFSTQYIENYANTLGSGNTDYLRQLDRTVTHELIHLWQDASDHISSVIDNAVYSAPILIAATNSAPIALRIAGSSAVKNPELTDRRHVLKGVGSTIPLWLAGLGISNWLNPQLVEKHASRYADLLVDLTEFQQFRGQYFSFEQVDK